jgi:hypothetical protein
VDWAAAKEKIFQEKDRAPVLVLGTGLLKQLMKKNPDDFDLCAGSTDWIEMLEEVADHLGVPFFSAAARSHPTLYWDCLMSDAASRSREARAWQIERKAIKYLRQRLARIERSRVGEAWVEEILSYDLRSLVSLNFCLFPFSCYFPIDARGPSREEAVASIKVCGRRIWFPHGATMHGASIRLGVRAYALSIERFERDRRKARMSNKGVWEEPSFMGDILESPLVFIGCGLQDAEWTIWWMLATKRRNQARVCGVPTGYFVTADAVSPESMVRFEMLGCKVLKARSHDEAWSGLGRLLKKS